MAWFDTESGRFTHPVRRQVWVGVLWPVAFVLAETAASAGMPEAPRLTHLAAAAGVALTACLVLARVRGLTHVLGWLGLSSAALAAWGPHAASRLEPPVSVEFAVTAGFIYFAVLLAAGVAQAGWYSWARFRGRPLPIFFDRWLGMPVKSRPRGEQVVAYVVYPFSRTFEVVSGQLFNDLGNGIPIRSGLARLPEGIAVPADLPQAIPGSWQTVVAQDARPHVRVFSLIRGGLVADPEAPPDVVRSLLGPSFDGFLCLAAGHEPAFAESIPVPGGRLRLGLRVQVPSPANSLTVDASVRVEGGSTVLRVERLRLGEGRLTPAGSWESWEGVPRILPLAPQSVAAVLVALRVKGVLDPDAVAVLLAALVPAGGPALRCVTFTTASDGPCLRVNRTSGPAELWAELPTLADDMMSFVTACHRWMTSHNPLPESLGLDAATGALVGINQFAGWRLTASAGVYHVLHRNHGSAVIPVRLLAAWPVAQAVRRVMAG